MEKVVEYPLPKKGEITFYIVIKDRVYMAKDMEKNINEGNSRFTGLFNSANNLISEIRKVQK